jgi:hypothetical protein
MTNEWRSSLASSAARSGQLRPQFVGAHHVAVDVVQDLEILYETGTPLSEWMDFDSLDKKEESAEDISALDYEELN